MTEPRDKTAKRKRTEEALRESEERYRDLLENANDLIQSVTPEGTFIYVNRAWRETLGYREDEVPGLSLMDIIHPDSKAHCAETFQLVMAGEDTKRIEAMFVAKDGRTITVEGNVNCRFKEGKPVSTRGIFRDVTQHGQVEETLRESEARYNALFAGALQGMIVADLETKQFRHANPAMCRMFGYSEEEFLRLGVADIHPKESLSYVLAEFESLAQGKKPSTDLPCRRKDGSLFYAGVNAIMVALGGRRCNVAFFTDVSERKEAEEALRESEARYKALFAGAPQGMLVADLKTKQFRHANPAMCRMFGYTEEEFLQLGVPDIHPKESMSYVLAEFETQARGEKLLSADLPCRRKDGSLFYADVNAVMVALDGLRCLVGFFTDVTESKKAAEALRESEEKFRTLSASAPIGIFLMDDKGEIIYTNERLQAISGAPPKGGPSNQLVTAVHPDDRGRVVAKWIEAEAEPAEFSQELRILTPQGETRWVRMHVCPIFSADGNRSSVMGTVEDITERRNAEEALRESEARYKALFAGAPEGMLVANLETKQFRHANPAMCRMFGHTEEEFLRIGVADIHPKESLSYVLAEFETLARGEKLLSANLPCRRKDGSLFYADVNAIMVALDGLRCLVGFFTDVTESKKAAEALRESEEKYRQLVENLQEGVWAIDKDANTTFANPRMAEILGCTVSEMLGRRVYSFMNEQGRELTRVKLERRRQGIAEQYELEFLRKDGTRVYTSLATNPVTDRDGNYIGAVAAVTDITDKKQTEEEIANRLKMESAIAQASTLLAGPEDADAGLDLALRILGEAFGADRAHIFLFRDDNTRMDCTGEWCAPGVEPQIHNFQDFDCASVPWWMEKLAQNDPIIMTDTSAAPPDAVAAKKSWKALNIRSLLAVPLLSDGKPIGYVRFANMESASNEREEDTRLLRLASESITSFIERQRAGEDKREAYESIVMLLATGAEARDPYTEDHLYRIRGFAEAMAAELGLPPAEIREIGLCSLLHDLGKMRVPDSILTKPGPLSGAEWKIMKQHPAWGEELLSTHPWLETARQIARWHHENWDGTGYPDGLSGEEIPLCAAIIAVADGFDAMTSDRPYKKAWPSSRAIREIRAQRGRQYSPDVVEAFNRALRKGEIGRITSVDSARLPEMSEAA